MITPAFYHCPTCDEPYESEEDAAWCCMDRRQDFQTRELVDAIIAAAKDAVRKQDIPLDLTFPPIETHTHKWTVRGTSLCPALVLVSCQCGASGRVGNYTPGLWSDSYYAPSDPFDLPTGFDVQIDETPGRRDPGASKTDTPDTLVDGRSR